MSLSSPAFPQGPTTPQIFFGHDVELMQIVDMITANVGSHPSRIAILGPGGYGKTTLAHAVLTAEVIRENFGDAIYFIPCESVTSSGALLNELGKTLGVLEGGTNTLWSRIQAILTSKDSIICFDNFESPWDQNAETKHSVEALLSRVTETPHVTVLITMRGAERPAQTQWTQPFLRPLETLDHNSAKEIWQAIAGNYDDSSEKLIQAVDYVPLAVDLLSHLSQVTPPQLLWEEWNSKQIKAIQTGQEHRLSNLEYSIQLSVDSGRMKANPAAKNLLGVLSMLPDGLHMKQLSKFKRMFDDIDIILCLQTLLQCSLIKLIKERYQPHPIIRHFCLNQGMVLPMHKKILESVYTALGHSAFDIVSSEAYEEMILEVNNTKATLLQLLASNYEDQSRLVDVSINFTMFCMNIGDYSEKVISQAVEFVQKNSGVKSLLIKSFQTWGRLNFNEYNIEKAQEKLQEAERLCLSDPLNYNHLYGSILEDLGDIYNHMYAFSNAEACYQKALTLHIDSNDINHQGTSYGGLGYVYLRQGKINEASAYYQSAIQCHEKINNTFQLGWDYKGLGQVFMRQDKPIEAESAFQEALKFHKIVNANLEQGHDYKSLGELYLMYNKLDDATAACEKALELYKLMNSSLSQGNVHYIFGFIHIAQGNTNNAENSFIRALEFYTLAKSAHDQGLASSELGQIYMSRGQLYDAKEMFENAIVFHRKAQNSALEKKDAKHLNVVINQIKESGSKE